MASGILLALSFSAGALAQTTVSAIAGTGVSGFSGDGSSGTSAAFSDPAGIAVDTSANVYIADSGNHRVRLWTSSAGIVTTISGTGVSGFSGDGGVGTSALLARPYGVAVDAAGNVYIADTGNNRVRSWNKGTSIIVTIAGNGMNSTGFAGDGGAATSATLGGPACIAIDTSGNLYITQPSSHRVRLWTKVTRLLTTLIGTGSAGFSGDGGAGMLAQVFTPRSVAVDSAMNVYVADSGNHRVRLLTRSTGIIQTIIGNGTEGFSGDGGAGTNAMLSLPWGVAVDAAGIVYISDNSSYRVRMWAADTRIVNTFAGTGAQGNTGDGGASTSATFNRPVGLALDAAGNVFVSDIGSDRVRAISWSNASPSPSATPATGVTAMQMLVISTIIGDGIQDFSGDGGAGTNAALQVPTDVAVDSSGDVYIADTYNHRVRLWSSSADVMTTIAGNGVGGFGGDGGVGTSAALNYPFGVTVDTLGNGIIGDTYNHRVRLWTKGTGVLTTIVGSATSGFNGDGLAGTSTRLYYPTGVAVHTNGNVYIADTGNNRVRLWTKTSRLITTIAGTGATEFNGDGLVGSMTSFSAPRGVSLDSAHNVVIADNGNNRVRLWTSSTKVVTTIVGSGAGGFGGDGGSGTLAAINGPVGVVVDAAGNVFFTDYTSGRIRLWNKSIDIITSVAGNGADGFSGDGNVGTSAMLSGPIGIDVDSGGSVYVADVSNNRVRTLMLVNVSPTPSATSSATRSATPSHTPGLTPSVTAAPTLTPTRSASPSSSSTGTSSPSTTPSGSASATITATSTYTASATLTASMTFTSTPSRHTASPTSTRHTSTPTTTRRTQTPKATLSGTASTSATPSSTKSSTKSVTATRTTTAAQSSTKSMTATVTATHSSSRSRSPSRKAS